MNILCAYTFSPMTSVLVSKDSPAMVPLVTQDCLEFITVIKGPTNALLLQKGKVTFTAMSQREHSGVTEGKFFTKDYVKL